MARFDALAGALTKEIEDVEGGLQVAGARAVVELVAQPIEACDVGRREIHAVAVELIEILIENRRRQGVVEARQASSEAPRSASRRWC